LENSRTCRASHPANGGANAAVISGYSRCQENDGWHRPGPKNRAPCRASDMTDSAARNKFRSRTACGGGVSRQASSSAQVAATTWLVEQIPHNRAVVASASSGQRPARIISYPRYRVPWHHASAMRPSRSSQ